MSIFQIKNRRTGIVQCECEIDAAFDGASFGVRLGLAAKKALVAKADLRGADLSGAELHGCNLKESDLSWTKLSGADLSGTDLRGADLSGCNLHGCNLRESDLREANLRWTKLSGADLHGADLLHIKQDFLAEVLRLPNELEALRAALVEGRIDGSTYSGECCCLAGTLARAVGVENYNGRTIVSAPGIEFHANASSPRESFFSAIRPGDTPDKCSAAAVALAWTDEAIAIRNMIRATAPRAA